MSTVSNLIGTRTSFSFSGLSTLANVTYVASTALDISALVGSVTAPWELNIEFEATPGTVAGNKQGLVFVQTSMNGTDYGTGPTSGTTVTDQPNLELIGILPLNTNSTQQRRTFPLIERLRYVPYSIKLVIFNDSGAAFSAAAAYYTMVNPDIR